MHISKEKTLTGFFVSTSILAISGILPVQTARSQTIELPGIIVEATSLSGEALSSDQVGSSVTVITGKQLEQQKVRDVADALRGVPGVSVNRTGGTGGLTNVRIRGAESNHTLVIIDGVEANSNDDGSFDFSDLTSEDIEKIEIIRGPQSGIYGSRALGGVINITTRKGSGPLKVIAKGEGGTSESGVGTVNISGGTEKFHASLTVDRFKTEGFNISPDGLEKDGSERTSVFFNGGYQPLDNLKIDMMLRNVSKQADRDDAAFMTGEQEDTSSSLSTDMLLAGARVTLETFDKSWIHKINATKNITSRQDFGQFGPSEYESETNRLSYINTWFIPFKGGVLDNHSFTSLAEYKDERLTPSSDFIERQRERVSFAAEYKADFAKQLSVSASARHDSNSEVQDFTTYKLAGSWRAPKTGLRLHSSIGTGVVFPTMFEQFGFIKNTFEPNNNIRPEESHGWDAGIEWTAPARNFMIDITYFDQDLKNEIETYYFTRTDPDTGDTLFLSSVRNRDGKSLRRGIEISATAHVNDHLTITGGYTFLDATEEDGSEEIRRPKHSAKVNLNYNFLEGKGNVNLGLNYNGKTRDLAFPQYVPTSVTLDDYFLVTLAGSYKIQPNVELFGRVENLLDEDYQEVFGFDTAGVSAFAGVKIKLGPVDQ